MPICFRQVRLPGKPSRGRIVARPPVPGCQSRPATRADDYFDNSAEYNFLDSGLLVSGPVVAAMEKSFELYWNSPWATPPPGAIAAGDEELSKDFLEGHDAERQLGVRVRAAPPRSFSTTCDDLSTYFVLRGDAASLVKMTLSLPLVRCFDFLL